MSDPRDKDRRTASQLISDSLKRRDPTGWFEQLYAGAEQDGDRVPWARMQPDPDLSRWLHANRVEGQGRRAIVIGCGLGDDAKALHDAGFRVTAFDISPTAIDWATQRFADSGIDFQVADLFALPAEWRGAFDLVFENRTIQALPWDMTEAAVRGIADCVAPGGDLLLTCRGREPHEDRRGIPWPLSREELALFAQHGLSEQRFVSHGQYPHRRFWVEYRKAT